MSSLFTGKIKGYLQRLGRLKKTGLQGKVGNITNLISNILSLKRQLATDGNIQFWDSDDRSKWKMKIWLLQIIQAV